MWVRSLEEGTATHSSILAWGIPWTEEPGVEKNQIQQSTHSFAKEQTGVREK